ncbi:dihydroorotate dehydrogenase (NAD+) catalytic subunit [Tindallia magadiensis]|uniref:Dihydroorotate dehydrogenase n=1 Tax=Tindallia magadiensis TaxID=69895 RepID=A0A1I3HJH8_9FIRM|nr:dihydroorotate dehydrogenase [Tindallia magadiensis]SFI35660.1 dihydroorotate dehydrogenase (NAD+) catalytic subunit [Tindallia magadiensis]
MHNKAVKEPDLSVDLAGVKLKNPIMTASGTFGSGKEYGEYIDLNRLGAIVVKGVSLTPWKGNPTPRVAETYGGMLNAVGLQNPGVEAFIKDDLPFLKQFDTKVIVNVSGKSIEEYCCVAERLADSEVDMLELNISCPNIKEGGITFGIDEKMAAAVVKEVRKRSRQPLMVKLSPNVSDITKIAKVVEEEGADALSLINTLLGMAIDTKSKRPVLGNIMGGLSGPAIKPVALRMVYQVCQTVKIPVVGMGGIMNGHDAAEFILAGANAVAIGTANFTNPCATMDVMEELIHYMREQRMENLEELRNGLII